MDKRRNGHIKIAMLACLLPVLPWSCQKAPTENQLQGGWIEITKSSDKSRLVFQGEIMYFYHSSRIDLGTMVLPAPVDTFNYTLDRKHLTIYLNLINHPALMINSEIQYHSKKKILNISSLFPPVDGQVSQTNYQPQ